MTEKEKCHVCGNIVELIPLESLRETVCPDCGAPKRTRDLAYVILKTFTENPLSLVESLNYLKNLHIYEAQCSGPIHNILKQLPNYSCSEYIDKRPTGSIDKTGIRCEDLQELTFQDNSFDLIITQDVLEHVANPEKAFSEINRVLKTDGVHIFTLPLHEGRKTVKRALINEHGILVNLLPLIYHDDPLRSEGSQVLTDFGDDIIDYLQSNKIPTEIALYSKFYDVEKLPNVDTKEEYEIYKQCLHERNLLKYFKYNSIVFRSRKHMDKKIEFTGERFMPWIEGAQIHYEHFHRYAFAAQFVKGKRVLDLASGEGYGSNMLSKEAEYVAGMDIDENTVNHARGKYIAKNLEFIQGSMLDIPIQKNEQFDVIVCFEALEHIEDHEKLLSEVKRFLKKDGLFIVSTPNKKTYTEEANFNNIFHKKELYLYDFSYLLDNYFQNSLFFGQRVYSSSNIWPVNQYNHPHYKEFVIEKRDKEFSFPESAKKDPLYFIALASDKKLDNEYIISSNLIDSSNSLIGNFENQISEFTSLTKAKDDYINELTSVIQAKVNDIQVKDAYVNELTSAIKAKNDHINELTQAIQTKDAYITQINESVVWRSLMLFHKLIEKIFPPGTKRRRIYDFALNCFRTVITNGYRILLSYLGDNRHSKKYNELKSSSGEETISSRSQEEKKIYDLKKLMKYKLSYFLLQPDKELSFPKFEEPIVSIIILTFNKAEFTYQCFESILSHTEIPYELIIVDNGSTDETISLLDRTRNITIIKNKENLGFIKGCNQGAGKAKGKYVLFLNNDIVVTPQWLSNLVNTHENYPNCGAVGCKLVWPNGLLQEAGSIIWNDGSALGYGRGDNPLQPEYSYLREVDYCSGACLLVRKDIFQKIGGFDELYIPAYYEDSDICMSIWKLGYKVVFQPDTIVFHHEFTSSSFEKAVSSMEANKAKFVTKWCNELKSKSAPSSSNVFLARNQHKGNRILVLDDRIPSPDQGSGFPRAYQMLRFLGELGYNVTSFPLDNTTPWQPTTDELQQSGIEVFYGEGLDFIKFAKDRMNYYDLIIISRPHNMKWFTNKVKTIFSNAVLIYDAEGLFSIREILKAKVKGKKLKETEIEKYSAEEIDLMKKADVVVTVSENEKETILKKETFGNVFVWGHPINVKSIKNSFNEKSDILFVGGFLAGPDSPNEDAILYFVKDVFPKIQKDLSCRLFIVGINPTEKVRKLSSSSIIVTGHVEKIEEYYERSRVFIVPHRYAAGIPLKLLEAMSYGIPSVVSELIASQLNLTNNLEVLIANDSDEFVEKIIKLYQNEDSWYSIQNNAIEFIRKTCNPDKMRKELNEIIQIAIKMK